MVNYAQPHINTHYANTTIFNLVLTLHVSIMLVFNNAYIRIMTGID